MALKTFLCVRSDAPIDARSWREELLAAAAQAWPAFSWRFGRTEYEPHRYAYRPDGTLAPFDHEHEISVEQIDGNWEHAWDFVEAQCLADGDAPQVFGEAARLRFVVSNDGSAYVRFSFNHALVDGLTIFRFLADFEAALVRRGRHLELLRTDGVRRWRSGNVEYCVEDMTFDASVITDAGKVDYLSVLHALMKTLPLARVCHVVASPRHAKIQLAIAPVVRARRLDRFRSKNMAPISAAAKGTTLTRLWELYARDPSTGDRVVGAMLNEPIIGRRLYRLLGGSVLVSGFMLRHPRYLAFPAVHACQRQGIAICAAWNGDNGPTARIVRARNL